METEMIENGNAPKNLSLYERNPVIWDRIIKAGNKNIGELSKIITRACDLDRALCVQNSAGKWHNGHSLPTQTMEARALAYINNNYTPVVREEPVKPPEAPKAQSEAVLIVVVPDVGRVSKISSILAALGCTVSEF